MLYVATQLLKPLK